MRLLAVVSLLASATGENRELTVSLDLFQTSNSHPFSPTGIRVKFFSEESNIWDMSVGEDPNVSGLLIGASPKSVFFQANPTVKFEIRNGKYFSVKPGSEDSCNGEWHEIGMETPMSYLEHLGFHEGSIRRDKITPLWVQAGSVNEESPINVRLVLVYPTVPIVSARIF